jgi:hypothetical protein
MRGMKKITTRSLYLRSKHQEILLPLLYPFGKIWIWIIRVEVTLYKYKACILCTQFLAGDNFVLWDTHLKLSIFIALFSYTLLKIQQKSSTSHILSLLTHKSPSKNNPTHLLVKNRYLWLVWIHECQLATQVEIKEKDEYPTITTYRYLHYHYHISDFAKVISKVKH